MNLDCLDAIAVGMKTPVEVKANVRIIKGEQKPEDISVAMAVKEKHLHISDWCQGWSLRPAVLPEGALSSRW